MKIRLSRLRRKLFGKPALRLPKQSIMKIRLSRLRGKLFGKPALRLPKQSIMKIRLSRLRRKLFGKPALSFALAVNHLLHPCLKVVASTSRLQKNPYFFKGLFVGVDIRNRFC